MSGKISSHAFRTLSGFNRSLRKILFAHSSVDSYHYNHRDHRRNHHHDQSDHDGKKFKQRASYCFQFAAAFGAYCGFVQWYDKSICQIAFCEENLPRKSESRKSSCGLSIQDAIKESERLLQQLMLRHNCPGLVVTVTVDGKEIWSKGFGYADVENGIQCTPSTVMRIASISKPITMAAVAKLWEEKKLDLDRPIQDYVPAWPEKHFEGKKVTVTTRQLVSMLGGVRHYDRECKDLESRKVKAIKSKEDKKKKEKKKSEVKSDEENDGDRSDRKSDKATSSRDDNDKDKSKKKKPKSEEKHKEEEEESKGNSDDIKPKDKSKKSKSDSDQKEFYLKKHFASVTESLSIFKDDDLCCHPGTEYLYSTPAWTLVSAVVEGASGKGFPKVMQELFKELGLRNTFLDDPAALVHNRARFYVVNKKGKLSNAPYVDNSSKWAGGGLVSTSRDLCRFGNAMLYSFQAPSSFGSKLSFLRPETVKMIWSPVERTRCSWDSFGFYGMGWGVIPPEERPRFTREQRQYFSHTGGAVGASSVLLVLPRPGEDGGSTSVKSLPSGVVVAVIVNMQSVGMNQLALDIAKLFERVDDF